MRVILPDVLRLDLHKYVHVDEKDWENIFARTKKGRIDDSLYYSLIVIFE